ncbi:MAG: 1,4-alpha-glucan branching protein GlgB [Isosphaeraceae bacterium]
MIILSNSDLRLIGEGNHDAIYEKLGAHVLDLDGSSGTHFAVWAPHAREVSVIGDFNGWNPSVHPMENRGPVGVWTAFVPGVGQGAGYKYSMVSPDGRSRFDRADPYAFAAEVPPGTASRVCDLTRYEWGDGDWMALRSARQSPTAPLSIYEVHLGSWMRVAEEGNRFLTYRELAPRLADYCLEMGFTHVELMPVSEHPSLDSWGYQSIGFYSPSARFGTPLDLMYLVDTLHQRGIGVILDWVPGHFAIDPHGLAEFDGTFLYEPADASQRTIPVWGTFAFNYESPQVTNFLTGNALYWLDKYHIDGLRFDGIESMIRLDFHREPGEWTPNRFGGNENLAAIAFLQRANRRIHELHPGTLTFAEDATARPGITRSVQSGGLGFDYKWDLGWVHDTIREYLLLEPDQRPKAHSRLIFRMHYAFNESYLLPLSHDETKKGMDSLLARMPGDDFQQRSALRLLYGYMFALPGKKLLFMGDEFGQWEEWTHDASLDWHILNDPRHKGIQRWVRDLNTQYRAEPALHELDTRPDGFYWIEADTATEGVLAFVRKGSLESDQALVVCNFSVQTHRNFRVGVPRGGRWSEILNSDATLYGGSGQGNMGELTPAPIGWNRQPLSLNLLLPALSILVFKKTAR